MAHPEKRVLNLFQTFLKTRVKLSNTRLRDYVPKFAEKEVLREVKEEEKN